MAIFHFDVKTVRRSQGSSVVAAAAYRSASRLYDERAGRHVDFTHKSDVIHSSILKPPGASSELLHRNALWNAVEARELRDDAVLAKEITFLLPNEIAPDQSVALSRSFVAETFVARGMVADLNVHLGRQDADQAHPHAHVLLTTRRLLEPTSPSASGLEFGFKDRSWWSWPSFTRYREAFAEHVNASLAESGLDLRIHHRSFAARGIRLEPLNSIPIWSARNRQKGSLDERAALQEEISLRNGDRIIADPALALKALGYERETFTRSDLEMFLRRHCKEPQQLALALRTVTSSEDCLRLGRDPNGLMRFSAASTVAEERDLARLAQRLGADRGDAGPPADCRRLDFERPLTVLATRGGCVEPTSPSWRGLHPEDGGLRALCPTPTLAARMRSSLGIPAETPLGLERRPGGWTAWLGRDDTLIIVQSGHYGSRELLRILKAAEGAGARVMAVGDVDHLRPSLVASAFRVMAERSGALLVEGARLGIPEVLPRGIEDRRPDLETTSGEALKAFASRRGLQFEPNLGRAVHGQVHADLRRRYAHSALRTYAKALEATSGLGERQGVLESDRALRRAAHRLQILWPGSREILGSEPLRSPSLLKAVAQGSTQSLLRALEAASPGFTQEGLVASPMWPALER